MALLHERSYSAPVRYAVLLTLTVLSTQAAWAAGDPDSSGDADPSAEADAQAAGDAIALGQKAKEAFDAGRFEEARAGFAAADAQTHSPVFVLYRARCERALGHWRDARASLRSVADEALQDDAPEQWRVAVREAKQEHAALEKDLPRFTVRLKGAQGNERVLVNGEPYRDTDTALDPGRYEIVVERADEAIARRRFEAARGDRRELVFDLRPALPAPPAPPPSPPKVVPPAIPAPPDTPDTPDTPAVRIAGFSLLGVGGLGLVAGAVTGGLALERAAAARDACMTASGVCPDGDTSRRDTAERLAHASTATLVVGGAAAVAGLVLVVVPLESSPEPQLELSLGPQSLSLRGHF